MDKPFWRKFTEEHREDMIEVIKNLDDEEFMQNIFIKFCPMDFNLDINENKYCHGLFDDDGCKECWSKAFK